ncbi:Matrixin [Pseudomonas gessardii]|uniref:Matrixin family metalloprotease n=1 Tax=Pseudomonas hygromyciniae TaxID=2812000 RepID=A0ABX7K7A0_9PSED|nr:MULTISPECIES: matrixin family metalloprotease [Pseudomonas]MBN0979653.1 matrixin family metalloprotease [Pseudomonas hygromyciniae]MRU54410.1 matrixin family metalloprotease [Pseudomonas gessardii]NMX35841.1 matrixin family metalloprotease [Pseudomonas sp. WS 5413]NMY29652.1 matrixin family metalloprotease [Pseudomonas sp. WS 5021]NNA70833.1 matrixin family metalloprotease [Pseudomonas gessardii]
MKSQFIFAILLATIVISSHSVEVRAGLTESDPISHSIGRSIKFNKLLGHTLTYCVSNSFPQNKYSHNELVRKIDKMLTDWTQYANLTFTHSQYEDGRCIKENSDIDIRFTYATVKPNEDTGGEVAGRATFPWNGPPSVVSIDPNNTIIDFVLGHEIGHALGLIHEFVGMKSPVKGCEETNLSLVRVTEKDQDSIMHWQRCRPNTSKFYYEPPKTPSSLDKIAIACMYGFKNKAYQAQLINSCKKLNKNVEYFHDDHDEL